MATASKRGASASTIESATNRDTKKATAGESKSKRPSTQREPQVDVLAEQASAKSARTSAAKTDQPKLEADDRLTRSAGRHSGGGDADYVTEKGDARRRDPDINKNSQAQKDDVRDGQRDQDTHPKKRGDGGSHTQDGGARQAQVSRSRPSQSIGPSRK